MPRKFATETHCANGHEKIPENLYVYPSGQKAPVCKVCRMNAQRKYKGLPPLERERVGTWNRHKEDCPKGHPYDKFGRAKNDGSRFCAICHRQNRIRRLYGLQPEEWDALVLKQEGRCTICSADHGNLHVDHDHETGAVRGLLCTPCNNGIGCFEDDIEVLQAAVKYLRRHRRTPTP